MKKVTQIPEEIREYLSYDEITGKLHWIKKTSKHSKVGTVAGSNSQEYIRIKFKGINYLAHRLAWYIKTDNQPPNQIDHRNGNRADNAWSNLREADDSKNMHNKGKYINNTSGYKGVFFSKSSN